MSNLTRKSVAAFLLLLLLTSFPAFTSADEQSSPYRIQWASNILTISGDDLPGRQLKVWYLEAYCRPGSTDRDWHATVIGHKTRLVSAADDGLRIKLQCVLADGVVVDHEIRAVADGIEFNLTAHNPTEETSAAHWAQPCIRVGDFTGCTQANYIDKCFIFVDGRLARFPTQPWATEARYTPGQVWCPANVDRDDVNPRPLSEIVPSNGLIGCRSADGTKIMATAWEPYQELFQGVIICIHSDFRIGGLKPLETKKIRGKIYLIDADTETLLKNYRRDFPEHFRHLPPPSR